MKTDASQSAVQRQANDGLRASLGRVLLALALGTLLAACASTLPGAGYPRTPSLALPHPEETALGRQLAPAAAAHPGTSGFRIVPVGADGFLLRMQMIAAAQRSLDLQYFIFRGDDTGRLLTAALLRAAERGVRVRVLLDDGERKDGDAQIVAIAAHPSVEIRFYNPFAYRGPSEFLRGAEFLFNASRLDYRMHNKLLVVDNAVALVGGRNIGDQYFQIDPDSQYADDDVFAAGPMVQRLSASFDEFWNSRLSIPVQALAEPAPSAAPRDKPAAAPGAGLPAVPTADDYLQRVASGEPLNGILGGRLPLAWAPAQLVYDSPEKQKVEDGEMVGRLMHRPVARAVGAVQSELLMVTPYLIPGDEGMAIFAGLRRRGVRVRILTSSLESATVVLAQAGYMRYRRPLLEEGVELYEIRSLLGSARGSGQTAAISRYGNYSLHGKMFVFDRKQLFIGSMNFDQRSMHLNTEIGLIIDSPELAQQVAARFEAMVQPLNVYQLVLQDAGGAHPELAWRTVEHGQTITYTREPARSGWQRALANFLSLLPLDREL